jgi:hypothetical protein
MRDIPLVESSDADEEMLSSLCLAAAAAAAVRRWAGCPKAGRGSVGDGGSALLKLGWPTRCVRSGSASSCRSMLMLLGGSGKMDDAMLFRRSCRDGAGGGAASRGRTCEYETARCCNIGGRERRMIVSSASRSSSSEVEACESYGTLNACARECVRECARRCG